MAANGSNVVWIYSITNLPNSVRTNLGDMSDFGGPFSPGCGGPEPRTRFIIGTENGLKYDIAYDCGGIVYTWFILQFRFAKSGRLVSIDHIGGL